MYKILTNMSLSVMTSMFNRNKEIHKHMTRHVELVCSNFKNGRVLQNDQSVWCYAGNDIVKIKDYVYAFVRNLQMPTKRFLRLNNISAFDN